MPKSFIGFGKFSKYYFYILGAVFFRTVKDCIGGFLAINPQSGTGLYGFVPILSKHYLVQDFYKYIGYLLGGLIFSFILKKKTMNKEDNEIKKKKSLQLKELIYNAKKAEPSKVSIIEILIVCGLYFVHVETARTLYSFDFSGLDFWVFDIVFIILFMDSFFVMNYYKHQIYSLAFIIITNTILLLISSFLQNSEGGKNTYEIIEDVTGHSYSFVFFLGIFILLSCLLSYSRVKSKVLMYFNYISPYKIIYYYGIIGAILTSIGLVFVTLKNCGETEGTPHKLCYVGMVDDHNVTQYYYDNLFKYFEELGNNIKSDDLKLEFYFEIFLITPLYLAINFFEFLCEILIIYYLNPNYVLIRENLYYFVLRFIFILVNKEDYQKYITLKQFFILQTSELLALLGYLVYFEIIELRFCKLDKDLKKNIANRGDRESKITKNPDNFKDNENNNENEDDKSSSTESFIEEKENNNGNEEEELRSV